MKRINQLPPQLANQIAAGEVVQRPASIVKELMDNSIDSGADELIINLWQGGIEGIQVIDNGHGIHPDDLQLCITPHATSKITTVDDLHNIKTLGFRGEALSSIDAVAKIKIITHQAEQEHAWELSQNQVFPSTGQLGTTVWVSELFYNIPARKKFLKSAATEFRHCLQMIQRVALIRDDLTLRIHHNDKLVCQFDKGSDAAMEARIRTIMGEDFASQSMPIQTAIDGVALSGYLALPQLSRNNADKQFWYTNKRPVRDRGLSAAVKRAYADHMYQTRQPCYFLNLTIAEDEIDINIHPSKEEIKFLRVELFHFVQSSVKQLITQPLSSRTRSLSDLFLSDKNNPFAGRGYENPRMINDSNSQVIQDKGNTHATQRGLLKVLEPDSLYQMGDSNATDHSAARFNQVSHPSQALNAQDNDRLTRQSSKQSTTQLGRFSVNHFRDLFQQQPTSQQLGRPLAYVHGAYIISISDTSLYLIDVHAAHERILYEQFKQQKHIEKQPLLQPLELSLSDSESALLEMAEPSLRQVGFVIERQQQHWLLKQIPLQLKSVNVEQLLRDFISELGIDSDSELITETMHQILASRACYRAVRANQPLSDWEMQALIKQIEQTPAASQCNHGRPTWQEITFKQFDRLFKRGQ